jgi:hypothetical protein
MTFMTKGEAAIEGNLLRVYEIVYPRAVEAVATALRPRFESGELRGWIDRLDTELPARRRDPQSKIVDECMRRFVTSPVRALAILLYSRNVEESEAGQWQWDAQASVPLRAAGAEAMALDVLAYARAQGWATRRRGEVAAHATMIERAA